eukprot:SAG31_NODE_623_length_13492_cov_62.118196_6_plen_116_part_00
MKLSAIAPGEVPEPELRQSPEKLLSLAASVRGRGWTGDGGDGEDGREKRLALAASTRFGARRCRCDHIDGGASIGGGRGGFYGGGRTARQPDSIHPPARSLLGMPRLWALPLGFG